MTCKTIGTCKTTATWKTIGCVVLTLMPALLFLPGSAMADEPAHKTLREFQRTGKWIIFISDKRQKEARIYHSRRAGAFLILDSKFGKPLLIEPREKLVSTVAKDKILERKDKSLDLAADVEKKKLGSFRFDGGDVVIDVDDLVARLQPRPYLLGMHDAEDLVVHTPEYEPDMKAYHPDKEDVKALVEGDQKLHVVVFFGSWCPTCRRLLPRILRVEEDIKGSKIEITYYGLPKGRAMRHDAEARKYDITRIPTGVVFVNDKRVGEISSTAWSRPEHALRSAVNGL